MRQAPHTPGKVAAAPEMGAAMYSPVSSATGDSGRSHGRTNDDPANNAASAFEEQQKQLLNHPHNEAHPFPVGANQSARLKSAATDWTEKLLASSPVPVRHGANPAFVTHGDDKYITHNTADKSQWPGLAHELGHADVDQSTLGALSQSGAADLLMKASPIVGGAQGLAGVRWPVTLATAGLMSAPRIGSELAADYKGYQRLKELGADDKTLREYLSGIAGQQASYLMPAALAVGANRAMNFAMKHAQSASGAASYSEGPSSTFKHEGVRYSVDRAIAATRDTPVEQTPVKDLSWIFKYTKPAEGRLRAVDLAAPVLITKWEDKDVVVDGLHRLQRAHDSGLSTIPTRRLSSKDLHTARVTKVSSYAAPHTPDPRVAVEVKKSVESFLVSKGLPKTTPYALVAGAALYFHGMRPDLKDADIVVQGLGKQKFNEVHGKYEVDGGGNIDDLGRGLTKHTLDTRHEFHGVHFASLPATLAFKKALNRDKDQHDIRRIEAHLEKTAADTPTGTGAYATHAALNLGQAARDLRYFLNHPHADEVAPEGTPHHIAASITARIPSLASNLYYAALPPQLHHKKEDLEGISEGSLKDWFLHGYKPWEYPDPLEKKEDAHSKVAKHKLARRMTFRGLDISIETDTGDKREWYDPHADKHGVTVMKYPYGYIRKTLGTDGDHVDVYVGPDEEAVNVYVVNQMKAPAFKEFDEQKCMLGFGNAAAAKKAYLDHYTDTRFFGSMKRMSFEDFKEKVLDKTGHGKKIANVKTINKSLLTELERAGVPLGHLPKGVHPNAAAGYLPSHMGSLLAVLREGTPTADPQLKQLLAMTPGGVHFYGGPREALTGHPAVLAHEFGHALAEKRFPGIAKAETLGKLLFGNEKTAPVAGFAAGGLTGDDSSTSREVLTPLATAVATGAPLASGEGQAWYQGTAPLLRAGGDMRAYHNLNAHNLAAQVTPVVRRGLLGYGAGRGLRHLYDTHFAPPADPSEKVAGHVDMRFAQRSTLDKSHLKSLRDVLSTADVTKLPASFTVPMIDGSRAVVSRTGKAKPKLTLKTVLAAHMKSKDPVITIDTLHASKQAALSDQRVMDLAGFKQTPNKDLPDAQVTRGTAIEKEHTDRPGIAKQIAIDHLNERPDYYKLLERYVESAPPGAGDALGTKHASLAHLLFGPLGHVATNVFGRAAHHASNLAEVLAHRGLQHGLTETVTNPAASRTIKSLAGAEALVPYEAGLQLGAKLRDLAPAERAAHIQMLHTAPHTNAPVLSALRKAVGHEVAGTAPELAAKGVLANTYARGVDTLSNIANGPFDTGVQRVTKTVAGGAPLAGLFAMDPVGGAAHVGINAIREGIGNSTAGRKFVKDTFAHGLSGKHIPAPVETAIDYAVSPAVLDSYRAGRTLRGELPETLHPHLTNENLEQVLQHKHLLSRPQPAAAPGAPVPTQLFTTPPTISHTPGTPAAPAPHNLRVASDFSAFSPSNTANQGPGPTHNQVPGDFLGLPLSQPRGYRRIVGGHPETPDEGIARTFRFHDEPTDTYTMDGNTAAQPSGPAI